MILDLFQDLYSSIQGTDMFANYSYIPLTHLKWEPGIWKQGFVRKYVKLESNNNKVLKKLTYVSC